jgi:hypothetical protein
MRRITHDLRLQHGAGSDRPGQARRPTTSARPTTTRCRVASPPSSSSMNWALTKAATIHDGSVYAQGLVNAFAENFKALGGELVSEQAVNTGDTDMRPVLTTIAAAAPRSHLLPDLHRRRWLSSPRRPGEVPGWKNVVLMGADGVFSPDFVNAAGPAAQGMFLSSPDFSAFGEAYQDFLAEAPGCLRRAAAEHLPRPHLRRHDALCGGDRTDRRAGRRHAAHRQARRCATPLAATTDFPVSPAT